MKVEDLKKILTQYGAMTMTEDEVKFNLNSGKEVILIRLVQNINCAYYFFSAYQ